VEEKKNWIQVSKDNRPVAKFFTSEVDGNSPESAHRLINLMLKNDFKREELLETIVSAVKDFEKKGVTFDAWKQENDIPHNIKCDPINWRVRV
jgi:hypothetical protein